MNRTKTTVLVMLAALGLMMSSAASAQWYFGGNVGGIRSQYSDSTIAGDLGAMGITATGSAQETSAAGKVFLGYQFGNSIAVEGGYFFLGNYLRISGTATAPVLANFNGSDQGQGLNIDLVGKLPIGKGFSGLGRIGAAYFRSDATAAADAQGNSAPTSGTNNRGIFEGGLGLQYDFTQTVAGRVEWLRYFGAPNGLTGNNINIDFYSAGLTVKF